MNGLIGGLLGGLTGAGGGDPFKVLGGLLQDVEGLFGARSAGQQDGIESSSDGGLSSLMSVAELASMFA